MRKWTDEQLIEAVKNSTKYIEVAKKLGLTNLGYNNKTIKKYINLLNIDISHFLKRNDILKEARASISIMSNDELFCINTVDRKHIKSRIIKENIIKYECSRCGITEWDGEKLSLHLDHINGINNDNRLENLRFLCPNCHSLTESYCGKGNKVIIRSEYKLSNKCKKCQKLILNQSTLCKSCRAKNQPTKILWPLHKDLAQMINDYGYSGTGKKLGVSDNAVKKHFILGETGRT